MPQNPLTDRSIFLAAIDIASPAERDGYLARVCGDNATLRAEVQALLAAHGQSGDLLDAPDQVLPTIDQPTARPGTQIGPYKLLQQIGEGGMGVVYMAEQTEPVKRRVALKIIKPGMDTRQVIARFEAERQALSLMDHPNIAKVLDAGTTDSGRPYFVMELVKGQPITQYCDEKHLTPRQRLELLLPVCQAIQHAHQKGIIHRDIKPTNILVAEYDQQPVPKVIDFGVAKATSQTLTEKTMFTGLGQIVGTLEYMSPEQAKVNQLDIDTRSDIYSLGVLLYELLTGSTPFDRKRLHSAAFDEMLRIIREEEPPKPSTRLSDSHDSLPSISAQRHTEPAKLTKLVRGELDWIVMKALEKDRNRRYETANGFAMDVQRYLNDEQVQACPPSAAYRFRKFARRNKRALTMVAIVAGAMLVLVGAVGWMVRDRTAREQEIAHDLETRQAVIKERVTLALEEARKRQQEGRWKEALDAAKRAEALAVTGDSDEETHQRAREVLGDMQMLANLEDVRVRSTQNQAGFDLKEEDSGNARSFREYGIDIDLLDRDEAARRIRAREIRFELAIFLDSWSYVRRRLGPKGAKALGKDWKELLEIARASDPDPWRDRFRKAVLNDDRKALVELAASAPISSLPAETVDRLGDALINSGALEEAAGFLKKGQGVHPQDYWINTNLGMCLRQLNPPQIDEAIRYFTAALALRPESARSKSNLANALAARGGLDEAVKCYRKAIEIDPNNASHYINLGRALAAQGKWEEETAVYREAIRRKPNDYAAHSFLAAALHRQGRLDEAGAAWRVAISLMPNAAAHYTLGIILEKQGKLNDAIACFRKAIELNPKSAPTYITLGNALAKQKKLDDAIACFRKAIELGEKSGLGWQLLGWAQYRAGNWKGSIEALEKSCELQQDPKGGDSGQWFVLAMAYWQLGEKDKARGLYDLAVEWMDKNQPKDEEFRRFRTEASELLGVREKK